MTCLKLAKLSVFCLSAMARPSVVFSHIAVKIIIANSLTTRVASATPSSTRSSFPTALLSGIKDGQRYSYLAFLIVLYLTILSFQNANDPKGVTLMHFYSYRHSIRDPLTVWDPIHRGKLLYQMYTVDAYTKILRDRLDFIKNNQVCFVALFTFFVF
jgi:hypothetical protein